MNEFSEIFHNRVERQLQFKPFCLTHWNKFKVDKMSTSSNKTLLSETTKKILQSQFRGEKTKISDDVVQLVTEIINAGVAESVLRAGKQAKMEGSEIIQLEHVEKVLPQLIMDL